MMFKAVIGNRQHEDYGVVTLPFPVKDGDYDSDWEMLRGLDVGEAGARDFCIREIEGSVPVLKQLEGTCVAFDELRWLGVQLDAFDKYELAAYQAMAAKLDLHDVKDFIDLTFCCQQATVITDFSDLDAVGRRHYLTTHGGCAVKSEWESVDGKETALLLLSGGNGTVTPYGVVFDNGMRLEQRYDGHRLPPEPMGDALLEIAAISAAEAEMEAMPVWLYLPASNNQIEHALKRASIDPQAMRLRLSHYDLPRELATAIDLEQDSLSDINRMCRAIACLDKQELHKLSAVAEWCGANGAEQLRQLAENLEDFTFCPGIQTAEEYGQYMIRQSGHFAYDENLEGYYQFGDYGLDRMLAEGGEFTKTGYVAYCGVTPLEELMGRCQQVEPRMGGMV